MTDIAAALPSPRPPARSAAALLRSTLVVSAIRGVDFGLSFLVSVLLAGRFGASGQLDAFFLARRTTVGFGDTIRKLVAQVVMPSVVARIDRGEPLSIHGLPRRIYVFLGGFVVLMLAGTLVPSLLVSVFAPGFTGARHALAARMMTILMPLLPIAVVTSLLMAVLQANRRYAVSEGSNILQRGILVAVLAFAVPPLGIVAGAWTMLAGGLVGLAMLVAGAWSIVRFRPASLIDPKGAGASGDPGIGRGGGIAAAIVLAVYFQASTLIDFAIASTVREGGVAVLEYGSRLVSLVPGLLMVSLNTVLYPELVRAIRDPDPVAAADGLARFQRLGFFIQVPVSVGMIAGAEPMVRILFGHGAFGEASVLLTTATTAGYAAAAIALTPLNATTAAIYADPRGPCLRDMTVVALGGLGLRGAMLAVAAPLFGVAGIAWAAAAATLATFVLAQGVAMRRFRSFAMGGQIVDLARTALCGLIAAAACWAVRWMIPMPAGVVGRLVLLATVGVVLVATYALAAIAVRAPEMASVRALLPRLSRR
jgi:putative peptidoglycan lipid II flippase